MDKLIIIGKNTADGDVSAWGNIEGEVGSMFEKRFCEMLARTTGTVFVVRGEIVRRYRANTEIPVECVEGNPLKMGTADLERKLKDTL